MASTANLTGSIGEAPPLLLRKFSVDECHQMAQAGVFKSGDPFELLEGWIVRKMTRTPPHDVGLDLTDEALRGRLPAGWRVRIQSAITTTDSEPEPDIAAVRGAARDYINRHPGPADIGLLIEVSDTSLVEDRGIKGRVYARARIPIYWIVNLVDRQVEVYADPTGPDAEPRYRQQRNYGPDETVPLVIDGHEIAQIPVRDILP